MAESLCTKVIIFAPFIRCVYRVQQLLYTRIIEL